MNGTLTLTSTSTSTSTSTLIATSMISSTITSNSNNKNKNKNKQKQKDNNESKKQVSLEKKLFHALHGQNISSPTLKEFHESWAFVNSVRSYFFQKSKSKSISKSKKIRIVIDVAGGHGAIAALFVLLESSIERSIVIDPAIVTSGKLGIHEAWFMSLDMDMEEKKLEYRHESLYTALPSLLQELIYNNKIDKTCILVVACHACQHLSDAVLDISERYGVHVAVMPCCQKDHNGTWKAAAYNLGIGHGCNKMNERNKKSGVSGGVGIVMDLLSAGKMMNDYAGYHANVRYNVKMKVIDSNITPQNRLIMCRSYIRDDEMDMNSMKRRIDDANVRLERAYKRAHKSQDNRKRYNDNDNNDNNDKNDRWLGFNKEILYSMIENIHYHKTICIKSMLIGVGIGYLFSASLNKNRIIK